jgi:serine protease Do
MKKVLLIAAVLGFTTLHYTAQAQEDKEVIIEKSKKDKKLAEADKKAAEKNAKETQEIIIRKKGDKDSKVTVEIKGDVVTINGKPLSEFKDGDITINKRNIRIFDGKNSFSVVPDDMELFFDGPMKGRLAGEKRAFLGVTSGSNDDGDNNDKKPDGAMITGISKGSAAEKAGLKAGDVITKINDKKIEDPQALTEAIGSFKPKDEVTVYYKRDGKDMSAKATLGENTSSRSMSYSFTGPSGNMRMNVPFAPKAPGSSFSMPRVVPDWNNEELQGLDNLNAIDGFKMFPRQQKLGLKIQDTEEGNGVKVLDTDKDSPAEKAGLKKDDIVTEIGGQKITNTDDAREQLQENADKAAYTIKAKRNGTEMTFDIKIPKKLKTANL